VSHVTVSGVWRDTGKGITCDGFCGLDGCSYTFCLQGSWYKDSLTVAGNALLGRPASHGFATHAMVKLAALCRFYNTASECIAVRMHVLHHH
jgi:hypothetical protein